MYDYKIFQGKILEKTSPREYTVQHIPGYHRITRVQLPFSFRNQMTPLIGSIVLILQLEGYKAYILDVLREPYEFLTSDTQYRGQDPDNFPINDGDLYWQATGDSNQFGVPGLGANFYLGNSGCALLENGYGTARLVVGGETDQDDQEVILQADNGFFESNINGVSHLQSTFNYDDLGTVQMANQIVPVQPDVLTPPVPITLSELAFDALGNVTLRNTTFGTGTTLGELTIDTLGNVKVASNTGPTSHASLLLTPTGQAILQNETGADITLTGANVIINGGTFGAARLNDFTLSSAATDPAFWTFIQTLFTIFNLHVHTSAAPGNPTSPPLTPLITFPTQQIGKINSASATVLIGN